MIKTLSTYILEVPFQNPTTSVIALSYTVKLYVWKGNKSAVPANPIYIFTKPNPTLSNGIDKLDISRQINDFFSIGFTLPTVFNTLVDGNNQAWAKWEIMYADTPATVTTTQTHLAVKGYGFYLEGQNAQLPTNRVLIDSNEFNVSYNSIFVLPILLSETLNLGKIEIKSFPGVSLDISLDVNATTNSNELVKYLFVQPLTTNSQDEYIQITFNGFKRLLYLTTECKYEPLDIAFLNRNGAIEIMTFFKSKKESIAVTKESYKSDIDYQYNISSKSKFEINSGWIGEDKNTNVKQLLLSEKTWAIINNVPVPVLVDTKSLEFKTRVNEKLINYKIDFSYAFDDIY